MASSRMAVAAALALATSTVRALRTMDQQSDNWLSSSSSCDNSTTNSTISSVCSNDTFGNFTSLDGNSTRGAPAEPDSLTDVIFMAVTSVILGLMILITVIGNVFVIAAILLERHLQSVANYLIVSLAVADLMVACLVMPLGAVYEISKGWILGPELCDMWTSSDVLCCTASILHLVAIAVDRYWAVTNVDYIQNRNGKRIGIMILLIWSVAIVVSLAPQFGWKDPGYLDRINLQQKCLVSQDIGYQIFATCSTFYVPLLVILVLYWKIFQTARKRIRHRVGKAPTPTLNNSTPPAKRKKRKNKKEEAAAALTVAVTTTTTLERPEEERHPQESTTAFTISVPPLSAPATPASIAPPSTNVSPEKSSTNNGSASHQSHISDMSRVEILQKDLGGGSSRRLDAPPTPTVAIIDQPKSDPIKERRERKETMEAKRERKAAKTLAIITGAFVICWLPFFIMALLMPLCESCYMNDYIASFFLWLGYFNSTLNPVIYTIFSPEFRQAFKRILCGSSARSNYRPRKFR
ncbi:5-hydroxytryptamine receptor-like [Neocloeon triangulifer]|uniref:5-hydroxytryptamine receptor-like n=1 Tax=Neocloeon triangulifer TaxID=2078957 RepID=UPI00286F4DF7|nr:5-hydroxytryptamine receptor-like [Neocloeon triangulifer]XP_059477022.1 5-hydroxytryptamine receptor-like [Neocloeon triangulifer]XP_059477023.1 5-hydroxytryptamine receptor-like [Neocloeon triangulifer]XP_059477024.1 5-hydroxytryptamine receptor-like [Neocloeon triangulifer]XP_059477025.1 5-hydroxytryptamine receptor-like [Neocloeon triangulifer]